MQHLQVCVRGHRTIFIPQQWVTRSPSASQDDMPLAVRDGDASEDTLNAVRLAFSVDGFTITPRSHCRPIVVQTRYPVRSVFFLHWSTQAVSMSPPVLS